MNTRVLRFTAIFALALLSGCSLLSGSGPTRSAILDGSTDPAGAQYDVVDLQAGTIAPYLLDKNRKDDGGTSDGYAGNIRVMPGDVLRILVADSVEGGLFAPLAAGGTLFEAVRVDANGAISLPYAGRLKVQGKSLPAIEEMVKGSLRHSAAVQPQVMVDLADDRSNSVLVAGAVPRPGRFGGIKAPLTALDAITLAGGSTLPSYQADVVIRHGREVKRIPYYQLLNGRNVAVEPRSELVVEPNLKRFVAMGALSKPGLHELPSNQTNLLDALGVAGGLNDRAADATGVFVFRLEGKTADGSPKPIVFRLNMRNPESMFLAKQFELLPEDVVYVSNAPMYEWEKIITPIVQVLIVGQRVGTY
ncbi:capsule biosynthesis protein CapA [Achromobacter denitrificans]|jgi:polysaccharide export outer membrane protein|uniref:Polysaccharide biosynthesis/export family protein n=1 Tax=Achromobacter denitrificans TaxID=32002 RepID=A0A3R9G0B5_ACHDE|nr:MULTISPECIES: polysaccharide biosynthesis/export family protein [Achromobacter]ASC67625.1 capsule biosynthesis protein CapA [Achromobacter denitrificans]MBV2157693.1 polysaccharide biosynthesis/export family protein [Achromobacter denitrificans]MDF3849659.1 polysaccharide biosynthesis/export family protein [Achromobacter denitrificans]MDF3857087.1 polysaccharide biosynthesis/export family protein [Achromobacter denitrificans]MDF3944414.1 polysaccharide biosynthesis/export family protein [Ac